MFYALLVRVHEFVQYGFIQLGIFYFFFWKTSFSSLCVYCLSAFSLIQTQISIGVLIKMCSENMQQIYRRRPIPKCDFNKIAKQLYWNGNLAGVFCYKFAAYFQNTFSLEHLWRATSVVLNSAAFQILCDLLSLYKYYL